MSKYLKSFFMLMAVCGMVVTPIAYAQEAAEEGLEYLLFEEVPTVFLSTKRVEKTNESAMNIRVIHREDIKRWGFQTLLDVFNFLENSFVGWKGRDTIIGTRGVAGYANDKIKFLIDGFELPFELGLGEGEFPVTLDEVQRIEITKGPNTAIFGGNATQATVNVIRINGSNFQGTRVGTRVSFDDREARGLWVHHADAPTDDLNYDIYFNTYYDEGWSNEWVSWGAPPHTDDWFAAHDRNTPIPDHELIAAVNYTDFRMIYRRVEGGRTNKDEGTHNRNYTDAVGVERTWNEFLGNDAMSFVLNIEASAFGQEYDIYHQTQNFIQARRQGGQEHKAEKRLEWDAHVHYDSEGSWDLLAGLSGNYWRGESTPWGGYITESGQFPSFPFAPTLASGTVSDEYFPSFTEINDLADWEAWVDWKWTPSDTMRVVLGGRYVYDFEPDDQLRTDDSPFALFRTDREFLRDFFPKAAVVWLPQEKMAVKLIYQEGFNRPNVFEQFSMQKAIEDRGRLEATTAQTIEAVLDWTITDNLKTLVSVFSTEMNDFVNFVYTGPGPFPVIRPGDAIGFVNVGDQEMQGLEASIELKYDTWGALVNFGLLDQNEVIPSGEFDPNTGANSGGTGSTGIKGLDDQNKQTYPEYTLAAGAWIRPMDDVTLSVLWKHYDGLENNESGLNFGLVPGTLVLESVDLDVIDVTLNWDNIFNVEGLDLQLLAQNAGDEDQHVGSFLDPAHFETYPTAYYQAKVSYLWGEAA